jgi:autotransporter-associated beta strand protein
LEIRALLANSTLVFPGPDGRLVYTPQADGDQIPDFSGVGYLTGNVPLPDTSGGIQVPVTQTINPGAPGVDMHDTIQNAINSVSGLTPDANGFRGAIQLAAGNYPVSGTLNITTSGVVLIGAGNDKNAGTRLEAIGTTASDARILINVTGSGSRSTVSGTTHNIQGYVPVGAKSFTVDSTSNLHVGDTVIVHRPSTTNWIHDIGMDLLTNPWTAGQRDLNSDRTITAINGNTITIDAPITNSLDPQYGGGTIYRYTWSSRISNVGLMNMYTYSDWVGSPSQPDTDTTHATGIATLDKCVNCWIENLTADNFATNVLNIGADVKWSTIDHVTIQNTSQAASNIADAPSGIGGTMGTLVLCENITLTNAYHAISAGGNVAGPNVYTNITITDPLEGALNLPHSRDETGPHQRWSTGGLFDNLSNTDWVNIRNAGNEGSGHGWQGANYVLWNVNARTDVSSPPTAQNWIIGGSGSTSEGTGIYDQRGSTVLPQSLYAKQLWDRTHEDPTVANAASATPNPLGGNTSTNLSVLGAESGLAESSLMYTWAVTSKPNGAPNPAFGGNGTNAAKNTTASNLIAGTYIFVVTIQDAGGLLATSTVIVTPIAATTINGTSNDDNIRIVRNGTFVDVLVNDPINPVLHQDYATSPELILEGQSGNDTITVDYSGGNPVPAAGLIVDGGTGTTDTLAVAGSSGADTATLVSGGTVNVNGGQFGYSAMETMTVNLGAGSDTLSVSGNSSISATSMTLNVTGGGTLAMTAGSTLPNFTDVNVTGAALDVGGTSQTIDSLNGNGVVTDNGSAATLTVGALNGSGTFSGNLTNGAGVLSLTKTGSGKLILSGSNSYSGMTTISGGVIESGNSASLVALAGAIMFNGGTLHVTGNTAASNVANKFNTNTGFAGASGAFDIDAGVTLTVGTPGGSAPLRTNGGGFHGGDFTKTGAGTLQILANCGQQDNVFHLVAGTIDLESATGLGGGDAGVQLNANSGTTLILKQDASTNFLTPISLQGAGSTMNIVIDRQTIGTGVMHSLNSFTAAGAFTLNVSAGPNVTTGVAGLTLGSVTLPGDGTFNVGANAAATVSGAISGAFAVTKTGSGTVFLNGPNTYTGATNVNAGVLQSGGSIAASSGVTVASGASFIAAATQKLTSLTIQDGGSASISPGPNKLLTTSALSINGSGRLDLADNALAVQYISASPINAIRGWIISGDSNGAWNGSGIDSTVAAANPGPHQPALGYAEATSVLAGNLFMGQIITLPAVLARYTLPGDANLDGAVNTTDFTLLAQQFNSAGAFWNQGDFNYSGNVNALDFNALATNFGQTAPSPPLETTAAMVAPTLFSDRPISDTNSDLLG